MLYRWQSVFGAFSVQEQGWSAVPAIPKRGVSWGEVLIVREGHRSRYVSIVHIISPMNSPRHLEQQLIHRYDYLTAHDPERSQVTERSLSFSDRSRNPRWVADVTSCCYRSSDPRLESRHPNDITHNTTHTIQKSKRYHNLIQPSKRISYQTYQRECAQYPKHYVTV
jgi:hypothetical protein